MSVRTYDPSQVMLIVGGVAMGGFSENTFITVTRDEDAYTKVTGADGKTSRAKNANKAGSIAATFKQTSPSNDILSGFAILDELSNSGIVPILLKDNLGSSIYGSATGWIRKQPDADFAKEISDREWMLDLAEMSAFTGGNDAFGS